MNKKIKPIVYKILKEDELARKDDNYLILKVIQNLEPDLAGTTFIQVMTNLKYKKISLESITRARRKFFEEYPKYKDIDTENARRKEEENYFIEYGMNHIPIID